MFKWLNPVNWVKSAIKSAMKSAVEEYVNERVAMEYVFAGLNKLVSMTYDVADDGKVDSISECMKNISEVTMILAKSFDPDGENGRHISQSEFADIKNKLSTAFNVVDMSGIFHDAREKINDVIAEKLA